MNSPFLKLNLKDLAMAMVLFVIASIVDSLSTTLFNGALPTWPEFKAALVLAGTGAIGYLIKNILSGPQEPKYSDLFKLNWPDVLKSLLMMFITTVLTSIAASISDGGLPTGAELLLALKGGLIITLSYLIKNFITNSEGKLSLKNA